VPFTFLHFIIQLYVNWWLQVFGSKQRTTRKLYITRVYFTKVKDVIFKELDQIKISEDILKFRKVE
jgi:hypothetical protein